MKLLYKHILILLTLMAFLPKWAEGQQGSYVWNYNVGQGVFYFEDAPSGYSGNKFTSSYTPTGAPEGMVYASIGTLSKVGGGEAWMIINTSHPIELNGTITVESGTLYIVLNGQILQEIGSGRVATINDGGTLVIRDMESAWGTTTTAHKGSLQSVTMGGYTYKNIWCPDNNGKVTITGGIITGGKPSSGSGGCIYVGAGGTLSLQGGNIVGNVAGYNGGGVYLEGNSSKNAVFGMVGSGCSIQYNGSISGGGVCALNYSTFTMNEGSINNNEANRRGGVNGGNGGAVYCGSTGVSMAINKGTFKNNTGSDSGGAFAINADGLTFEFGNSGAVLIQSNTTGGIGGGICAEGSTSLTFLKGNVTIDSNTAGGDGGGVCCGYKSGGTQRLKIYGATITNNKAGADRKGGGIYDRTTYIDFCGTNNINIHSNTSGDNRPNDIYLSRDAITVENGIKPVKVGIWSTVSSESDIKFFYSGSGSSILSTIYTNITNGTYNVYSNRTQYWKVKAYSSGNYIYFTNPYAWSTEQKNITASDLRLVNGVYEIATVKELTAFLCHVNGISTNDAYFGLGNLSAKGKLTANINMYGHYWVPIANEYKGTFDGNGYSISHLTLASAHPSTERGMFGRLVSGSEVKNLQLNACDYTAGSASWMGCIASRIAGGTIHDCTADGTLKGSSSTTMGGLVGASSATIHSCYARVTLSGGGVMGGLVGALNSGASLKNCFVNPVFSGGTTKGGFVGTNSGTIDNCYMRNVASFAGSNSGTIQYCYCPQGSSPAGTNGCYTATVRPRKYRHADNQVTVGSTTKSLLDRLNERSTTLGYTRWMRTDASPVNDDYPILRFEFAECVGYSADNTLLEYSRFGAKFNSYVVNNYGTIYLYKSPGETITDSNNGKNTKLYIQEDVALIHTSAINAYVGITLKNASWHMFSPALSDAPLGINYNGDATVYPYGTAPAQYAFYPEATKDGYFPSTNYDNGSYYADYDYYTYYEPEYHWINFKRNSPSHWHEDMDPAHPNIEYHWDNKPSNTSSLGNETTLKPGKGYLLGIKNETFLQSYGTLNPSNGTGDVTFPVTSKGDLRPGYNLIGNPYQAYLDFNAFATTNSGSGKIWSNASSAFYLLLYDGAYHKYVYGASNNQLQAPRCLHPHQGFMVISGSDNTNATFKNSMRVKSNATNAPFRDEPQIDYPLVNLVVTDDESMSDIATIELDRPDKGGAPMVRDLHSGKGSLYVNYDDTDYSIAFTQPGIREVAVRFATDEEATFTMTWDMENGDFSYVHLIDNMTGVDTDCLQDSTYCFTARPSDYKSRFRLVLDYTGIEEPEVPEPVEGPTHFAFQMGNELVVNGEGQLQMFDLTGRQVMTTNISGTQSRVALPELGTGIYVLRLNGKNEVITQKIVIE